MFGCIIFHCAAQLNIWITVWVISWILTLDFYLRVFLLEDYGRPQSSSVSPRGGGYCSNASTPHSSNGGGGGSYTSNINGYGGAAGTATPTSTTSQLSNMLPGSPSASIFNTTPSKYKQYIDSIKSIARRFEFFQISKHNYKVHPQLCRIHNKFTLLLLRELFRTMITIFMNSKTDSS